MNWKLYILLLISWTLLPFSTQVSKGCAGVDPPDFTEILMFNPEIIHKPEFSPFFMSRLDFYPTTYSGPEKDNNILNSEEWIKFSKNTLDISTLDWILYQSSMAEAKESFDTLRSDHLRPQLHNKALLSLLKLKHYNEVLEYFIDAKITEKDCEPDYYSWEPRERDTLATLKHLYDMMQKRNHVKDKFIKNRYDFQVLRTFHTLNKFEEGLAYYDKNIKSNKNDGSIYWRSLGYKASFLYNTKRYAASNLIFARIYDQYEPRRIDAYTSFHPLEEQDWNELLKLAKNTREKEVLWQLYGCYSNPLKGLTEIIKLNPQSDLTDLLLTRAVNIAENNLILNNPEWWGENEPIVFLEDAAEYPGDPFYSWSKVGEHQLDTLLTLILGRLNDTKFERKQVWACAGAFTAYLKEDVKLAKSILSKYNTGSSTDIEGQNLITSLLVEILESATSEKLDEEDIYNKLTKLKSYPQDSIRFTNTERYVIKQLSGIYKERNEVYKSILCARNPSQSLNNIAGVDSLINFMEMPVKSNIEKYFESTYTLNLTQLYEIKGIILLYNHNYKDALTFFNKGSESTEGTYGDPFKIEITDCHDCDNSIVGSTRYSRKEFTAKLVSLTEKIKVEKNPNAKAALCFELANGIYNMSYYGNSRLLQYGPYPFYIMDDEYSRYERFESNSSENETTNETKEPREISIFNDCAEAMKWYEEARRITTDKKFSAKCAWMAAKCEHNKWLEEYYDTKKDFVAGKYFKLLETDYKETNYYNQIINECGYFCTFNNGPTAKCIRNKDY